jgi:protein-tyrosine phosphatase
MKTKNKKKRILKLNKKKIQANADESDQCKQTGNDSVKKKAIFQIETHLFCSGYHTAQNKQLLELNKISHIINLTAHKYKNLHEDIVSHSSFSFSDHENFDLTSRLQPVLDILKEKLSKKENVLVHCQKGISRAPSVIMAFLILHRQMTFEESLKLVQKQNPEAYPNLGFLMHLKKL